MGAGRVRMGRGMTDEQITRLTLPELIELIKRLIEEVEIRAMQNVR